MDDLPELPFEKVLSYLSLEDRLRARAVSRSWYSKINSFKVKSLCYSQRPIGFIREKDRLITGTYAQNFIATSRFEEFFNTFGHSIFSSLKHLRLCKVRFNFKKNGTAFIQAVESFAQLKELRLFNIEESEYDGSSVDLDLSLPMLRCVYLENVNGIRMLTLDTPRLKVAKIWTRSLRLHLVHPDSVERLFVAQCQINTNYVSVKQLRNLNYLYVGLNRYPEIDSTFLSSLGQLKEIHLNDDEDAVEIFEQKRQYARTDLKIFYRGLLLDGPDDPFVNSFIVTHVNDFRTIFVHLAENPTRIADEIPFYWRFPYDAIDHVVRGSEMSVVNRFTDLLSVHVSEPVQDTQRFLDFLKNLKYVEKLRISCDQPQELFDRLPDHCAIQFLTIKCAIPDFGFLFRLKHLIILRLFCLTSTELIREVWEELPFLLTFRFMYCGESCLIVDYRSERSDVPFEAWIGESKQDVPNLDAVTEFIIEKTFSNSIRLYEEEKAIERIEMSGPQQSD